MEVSQQIEKFVELIESVYKPKLIKHVSEEKKRLTFDFKQILLHDIDLANDLIDHPEETLKAAEIAIEQFDILGDVKNFKARIKGVPLSNQLRIRDVRAKHIGRMIVLEGFIKVKSDIRPNVACVKFECPGCNNIMNVLQFEDKIKEPFICKCGRKGKFKITDKSLIDAYSMILEEAPETLRFGTKLGRFKILFKQDLCDTNIEERLYQGNRVRITGILKEVLLLARDGSKKTTMDYCLDANYIDILDSSSFDIKLHANDKKMIIEYLNKPGLMLRLKEDLFRGVYSVDIIKEGIILAIIEGKTDTATSPITNGKIMILLIGDTGQGKTTLMEAISPFLMKFRFVSGKGTTGVGILGAVVKDELTKGFAFEAGALALANDGILFLDEADKLTDDDRNTLHQPMSQLRIDISKANIQSTLLARTTVIAGANPKFGRFDVYENFYSQINLPDTLINRFDLIFLLKQGTDETAIQEEKQKALVQIRRRKQKITEETIMFFKKLFAFLIRLEPKIPANIEEYIAEKYTNLLSKGLKASKKYIPITQRQVGSIIKIAEAHAKLFKGSIATNNEVVVDEQDVDYALNLIYTCFKDIAFDQETGELDIDKITIGISSSERNYISLVKEILKTLENETGSLIAYEDIIEMTKKSGIDEEKLEQVLSKLKKIGDIYEPRHGFYSRMS